VRRVIKIELTDEQWSALGALVHLGLYGLTRVEAAERLLSQSIERKLEAGLLSQEDLERA
jgi:hypothetical protein